MKSLFSIVLLFVLVFTSYAQQKEDSTVVIKPVIVPEGFNKQLDVVYAHGKDWEEKMDIYLPPKKTKTTPVIINIHGGGWNHGTKESQTGFNDFFKMEFAVANVEYRLTPQATAPAAIEDIRCALIYLVEHATQLNIDPSKIVIMGGSAGGHLALLAGLMGNNHLFDNNCKTNKHISVAAIIDKWGIANMDVFTNVTKYKSAINWLGEHSKDSSFIASVSPVTYLNKKSPPVFIVHGDADPIVPFEQSVQLHKMLNELGVRTKLMIVPNGGHGTFSPEQKKEVNNAIVQFIKELQL